MLEEVTRKLVSVRKIGALRPIPNADAIDVAEIDGWEVVVKKGEFAQGDTCAYFEIDSFLPIRPEFEFLRKGCYKKFEDGTEGFRLRTIKLRGQISQGLALPLAGLLAADYFDFVGGPQVGDDITDAIGVTKYDPPCAAVISGDARGVFPSFIRKTDQERIQNLFNKLKEECADMEFEVSVKLDGSSMTVYLNADDYGVCSRNLNMSETGGNTMWKIARDSGLISALQGYGRNIAIQGEIIGPGIQKNPEKLHAPGFYVFDVWSIDEQRYVTPPERSDVLKALIDLGADIGHVPVLSYSRVFQTCETVKDVLALADGPSLNAVQREGLVFKAKDGSVSFKAISNAYLLKNDG